ncbi:UDP-4-amino-4-deoxy-L-arabinose--oxoglutarate aminotransferase [Candidatus Gugararchaeum adminiculabundum]|nr:UDP-4-amino-4-deoxy-L-arabinose--oxoglutarate aminotransferase [Candidatus Gugararchaeum adminiculabundum]
MIPIAKPQIGEEEKKAVLKVMDSGMLAQGESVKEFEKAFAAYIGVKYAVAVNSGTAALHAALFGCKIGPGTEVVTTPFTFIASANSILYCNSTPTFSDINPISFNLDPAKIPSALTSKSRAIMPVHLYGSTCEMDAIMDTAKSKGLMVIEDACQSHGSDYEGKKAGSIGDAGCFSFYPTKNMTTSEGGMVTTNNEEIAERAKLLREHGSRERYKHEVLGYNYRMTNIAAAIGIEQLKKLDKFNSTRRKNADYYIKHITADWLVKPQESKNSKHVYHQYTLRSKNNRLTRDEIVQKIKAAGIGCEIYYPRLVYQQPSFSAIPSRKCPEAEKAAQEVFSIPIHASLSQADLEQVVKVINSL